MTSCEAEQKHCLQLHPVVSRLCAPIEGTDAPRLAACLGLDPSRFRGGPGTAAGSGGGGDGDAREDALLAPGSSLDDPSRYQVCLAVSLSMACLDRPLLGFSNTKLVSQGNFPWMHICMSCMPSSLAKAVDEVMAVQELQLCCFAAFFL